MIPTSFLSRLSLPSPQQTERDLARLIHRTIELDRRANRQLGYAAVNIGCDGVRRVTMFDGSSCQTSGDVCLATREEGITVCLDTPSGNGLAFQRIAFESPACEPVTGWWLVDAEGYMYKVPAGLITAAPYWPMSADPAVPEPDVTLVRAGTWARLMCGAGIEVPLNDVGGAEWYSYGESGQLLVQRFDTLIGGRRTIINALPTVTAAPYEFDPHRVDVSGDIGVRDGDVEPFYESATVYFTGRDSTGTNLSASEEYRALVSSEGVRKGVRTTLGASAPLIPAEGEFPYADVIVRRVEPEFPYTVWPDGEWADHPPGELVVRVTATAVSAIGRRSGLLAVIASADTLAHPGRMRAILHRDGVGPNAGSRAVDLVLPSGGTGMSSGAVRVAYGYPFGAIGQLPGESDTPISATPAPYAFPSDPAFDIGARIAGDMALCYSKRLGVEYGEGHVNLDGSQIADASDFAPLDELNYALGRSTDIECGVIEMPGGEVALLGANATSDIKSGKRYRVRPAPSAPLTVTVEHRAKGAWGVDPNVWTTELDYTVTEPWESGFAEVTILADHMSSVGAPGRPVPCVLWEAPNGSAATYLTAPVAHYCYLGPTTAGVTQLLDAELNPLVIPASIYTDSADHRFLTILGPRLHVSYGWTVEIDGVESALSPLTDFEGYGYRVPGVGGYVTELDPGVPIYSLKIGVPGGPAGTAKRHVYRFSFDFGAVGSPAAAPWRYGTLGVPPYLNSETGAVYDRMCRRVATILSVEPDLSDGSDVIDIYDEDLSLSNAGTRPPSPLVYLGPIAVDAPRPVHVLQPMEL
jgi:hypothetical protein